MVETSSLPGKANSTVKLLAPGRPMHLRPPDSKLALGKSDPLVEYPFLGRTEVGWYVLASIELGRG